MSTGIGEALRTARQDRGRSVEDVAQVLRTRSDYLRALEDERFEVFGGDIYAKGFLRNYAAELGLDPQPLLETYRREHGEEIGSTVLVSSGAATRPTPRNAPPPWIAWVLVAVVVLAGLAFIGTLGSGRAPQQASQDPASPPPAPVQTEDPDQAGDQDDAADAEPEPEPEPEPTFDGVEVLLALEESSWMRVTIDGSVVLEETVPAGETRAFGGDGADEVVVRFGNAGGVRAQVNGEEVDSLGARGQVVEVRFTADGAETA
ncbi:helix-turn-helix domain-containing protein [Egicoccus sp. AB-alg2]|uniref:helix-turn-helix domain-containing protein n=1 Tax=Egicoccus sp. AB-alg2 TaxID=3242693 RepID=UPI00359E3F5E